ncbi:MAG: tryptophan--tRNA ligase [bacterium]|nr:tryptophan--tRNA ligase [bacterium]
MKESVVVSGVQPSGEIHIGNYLGAIKQFVELQNKYQTYFFIADLHALTLRPQEPEKLRKQTLNLAALYLACGLYPKKTTLFIQSHVPAHTELGWILSTLTPLGELYRMTQFKEKSEKHEVLAGLLNYPTLMAADILLYQADLVPVGEDQLQHLELTRTLARKFNSRYGKTFKEPKALLQKEGAKIMGLDDPSKKMSKSEARPANYIGLLDSPDEIRRKIKIAVTDSGREIKYHPEAKPAISNLLAIYSLMTEKSIAELEKKYAGKSYSEFKADLAEVLVEKLSPIQKKYRALLKNPKTLKTILAKGAKKASAIAGKTLKEVKEKIGLI